MAKKVKENTLKDPDEAIMAFENHDVGIHAKIFVRVSKEIDGEIKNRKNRD